MEYRRLGRAGVKVSRLCLGLAVYSPLAVGLLTGRFRRDASPAGAFWSRDRLRAALSERGDRVVAALVGLAQARGATPAQLALAWLSDHPEVTAPIVGADRPEHVDEALGALDAVSQWDEPGQYL